MWLRFSLWVWVQQLAIVHTVTVVQSASLLQEQLYREARHTRIAHGHKAAQPLYADLVVNKYPSDITTASRLASASGLPLRLLETACTTNTNIDQGKLNKLRDWLIAVDFTNSGVEKALNIPTSQTAIAPIYITPASAGTVHKFPFSERPTACQCLVSFFLLGLAVPKDIAEQACSISKIQFLRDLGLVCHCEHNNLLFFSVVSIMPLDLRKDENGNARSLFIVTDWHPRALNTLQITNEEEAVMYIGPDSLALIQHWILHPNVSTHDIVLDVCTGSGVQALACVVTGVCTTVVCVDINPRSLRFIAFSVALNRIDNNAVRLVQGDVLSGSGHSVVIPPHRDSMKSDAANCCLEDLLSDICASVSSNGMSKFDMITANPPFLPVLLEDSILSSRYGLFSAGGSTGEEILAAILKLSVRLIRSRGFLAIVSEFFFHYASTTHNDHLLKRLKSYCYIYVQEGTNKSSVSRGLLLTNQHPISSQVYAERRSDTMGQMYCWIDHFKRENIAACSPGLLYIQIFDTTIDSQSTHSETWQHIIVPKFNTGSIWTPSNHNGERFTHLMSSEFFHMKEFL